MYCNLVWKNGKNKIYLNKHSNISYYANYLVCYLFYARICK